MEQLGAKGGSFEDESWLNSFVCVQLVEDNGAASSVAQYQEGEDIVSKTETAGASNTAASVSESAKQNNEETAAGVCETANGEGDLILFPTTIEQLHLNVTSTSNSDYYQTDEGEPETPLHSASPSRSSTPNPLPTPNATPTPRTKIKGENGWNRALFMFEEGLHTDVTFIVGENRVAVAAHKVILIAMSPVFEDIISDAEVASSTSSIPIKDVEPHIFRSMLKFLYINDWDDDNVDEALPLYVAAMNYQAGNLASRCLALLAATIDKSNALKFLKLTARFKCAFVEELSLVRICKYAYEIVDSQEFLDLGPLQLWKILARDDLAVKDELQLYEALKRWAHKRCTDTGIPQDSGNCRMVLGDLIQNIRFPNIDKVAFSLRVYPDRIISLEEALSVFAYYNIPLHLRPVDACREVFNSKPREYFDRSVILNRLPIRDKSGRILGCSSNSICFRPFDNIMLTSIGLNPIDDRYYPTDNHGLGVTAQAIVIDFYTNDLIASKAEVLNTSMLKDAHHQIKFDTPVQLQRNTWYTATLNVSGNYCGSNFKRYDTGTFAFADGIDGKRIKIEFRDCKGWLASSTCKVSGQMATMGFLF